MDRKTTLLIVGGFILLLGIALLHLKYGNPNRNNEKDEEETQNPLCE